MSAQPIVTFSLRLPPDLYKQLEDLGTVRKLSINKIVVGMLDDALNPPTTNDF